MELSRREWLLISSAAAGSLMHPAIASMPKRDRIRLSLNENPFGPSPRAAQTIKADLDGLSRYTGNELTELTSTIAARENVATEQIVLGEILDVLGLYLSAQGGPGGEFVYSTPGYTALVDAVAAAGGIVVGVPLNERYENDLPTIADKVTARTRAVYLVNPHNPTGTVSEAAPFINFVRELSKRTLVIVDEAYLEFTPDFEQPADALATSARTLQRRCEAVLGKSPLSYFQDLRVERAQGLLRGTGLDVDAIAAEVGYVDGATLRTLLRERLGRGVRELRADLR
jgi:histidinol-phosphate aminotransferase